MKYIVDEQVDLNQKDFLGTKKYSDTLSKILEKSPKNKVFTIGLFGGWGTGKSSIIETSKKQLEKNERIRFVTYDAWQYSKDSFRRMFLRKLLDELGYEATPFMDKFYTNESRKIGYRYKFSIPGSIYIIITLLTIFIFLANSSFFDDKLKINISLAFSFIVSIFAFFSKAVDKLDISLTKPLMFAPEQFEDCFNEITDKCFNKETKIATAFRYINGDKGISNLDKLVIVIDNIDRCQGEVAYTLLSDIKTFLGSSGKNIVFVIPVDDNALKRQIFNKNIDDSDNEKEEFLRKSFNTVLRIKPFAESDMYEFCKQISQKNECNFNQETVNLASKEYSKNPRRVIQLFNNLLSELEYYDPDFSKKNQEAICACLIMHEEYPDLYQLAVSSPNILYKSIDLILKNLNYEDDDKKSDKLKKFVLFTKNIFKNAGLSVVEKILSDYQTKYSNLDISVVDAINNFDFDTIKEKYLDSTLKENIIDCIYSKLDGYVKNRITSAIINQFELISKLNSVEKFEKTTLQRYSDQFETFGYEKFLYSINEYDFVTVFIFDLNRNGFPSAYQYLVEKFLNSKDDFNSAYFYSFIHIFNDKDTSMKLKSILVERDLSYDNFSELSNEQYDFLISDEFLSKKIEEITNYQDFIKSKDFIVDVFSHKSNLTENLIGIFFTEFDDVVGKLDQINNDDLIQYLVVLNDFLDALKTEIIKSVTPITMLKIINYFHTPRSVRGVNVPKLIQWAKADQSKLELLAKIDCNLYRISGGVFNLAPDLAEFRTINKFSIILPMICPIIITNNITLDTIYSELYDCIIDFSNTDSIALFKYLCCSKLKNGNYCLTEQQIGNKLELILNNISIPENIKLLEVIIDERAIGNLFVEKITSKGSDFVNLLSSKSKTITESIISVYNEESKEKYRSNKALLCMIGQKGDASAKTILRNDIVDLINHGKVTNDLIDIIRNIKQLSINQIKAALEDFVKSNPNIDESLESSIKEVVGQ